MEISTDRRFASSLLSVKNKIGGKIKCEADRTVLYTPIKDNGQKVLNAIAHETVTAIKKYYMYAHTKIPDSHGYNKDVLIRVLSNYDTKTDLIIASALIKITPKILLDSLYDFRLTPLKKRWDEVVSLINANIKNVITKSMFDELLRFLVSNSDHKAVETHIVQNDGETRVCDRNFVPIDCGSDVLSTLIDISPKTVFIHENPDFEKKLIKNIETIFDCVIIKHAND